MATEGGLVKDKLQGKAEEMKGRMTGDDSEKIKGEARQGLGDVKDAAREIRDHAEGREDPV
jgi:uncharacterized protein YjbJ (UPF0337 family)